MFSGRLTKRGLSASDPCSDIHRTEELDAFVAGLSALSAGLSVGLAAIGPGIGQGNAAGYAR